MENGIERLLRAFFDPHLPALPLERDEVGLGERNEVVDEPRGGVARRRLDANAGDWRLLPSEAEGLG